MGGPGMSDGMSWMFTGVPILVGLAFAAIVGTILYRVIRIVSSPAVTVQATCTGKRQSGDGSFHHATFELLDGTRLELACTGREYGMLAEGDRGALTHQGDVLRSFTRGTAVGRD